MTGQIQGAKIWMVKVVSDLQFILFVYFYPLLKSYSKIFNEFLVLFYGLYRQIQSGMSFLYFDIKLINDFWNGQVILKVI